MAEYQGREQLEAWLRERPREVSVVIAARAALRVLPMMGSEKLTEKYRHSVILRVFHQVVLPLFAGKFRFPGDQIRAAAASTADGDDAAAAAFDADILANGANAAFASSTYATHAINSDFGYCTGAAAYYASCFASAAVATAISSDMTYIEGELNHRAAEIFATRLADTKLWPGRVPRQMIEAWSKLKADLIAIPDENWEVWTDWYDARLKGRPAASKQHELARALLPDEVWKQGPKVVNARIAKIIGKAAKPPPPPPRPPKLPKPGPGATFGEEDNKLDLQLTRSPDEPELTQRDQTLIAEARDAARDFLESFQSRSNAHTLLRKVVQRYLDQVRLDDPDIDIVFSLGMRLQNARDEAAKEIATNIDPHLEAEQREALKSLVQINAVVIATSKRGAELLAAADLYAFGKTDDLAFKPKAETVVEQVIAAPFLATVPAKDILFASVDMIGMGDHPHRTGMMGRNTIQRALIKMATVSGTGILGATAGQIFIHSGIGNAVITDGASLADKAIGFFLHNEMALRMLGASAPEGFGFLSEFIDWLKQRLGQ